MLVKLLDLYLLWANISLELLNFVIEHKFELFKLLDLLLKLLDLDIFLLNSSNSCLILRFTSMDVTANLLLLYHFVFKLIFLFLKII